MIASSPPEWDALLLACQQNKLGEVQKMLQNGVDPSHSNAIQQSALHIAVWWGHADIVELLLKCGANVHAANTLTGAKPLHCSIQSSKAALKKSQRLKCIDLLMEYGANPNAQDLLLKTPVEYLEPDDIDAKEILPKFEQNTNPAAEIFKLLKTQQLGPVQNVLKENPEQANAKGTNGITPLLFVVQQWVDCGTIDDFYPTVIRILMEAGADNSTKDEDDQASVDLLLQAIVQRYKQNGMEDSLLLEYKRIVPLLLYSNPMQHETWLEIARRNYLELAQLWHVWEITPQGIENRQGMTPLQFAARSGHFPMVNCLLPLSNINHHDQRGQTALDAAKANQHDSVVELLLQHQQHI